MIAEMTQDNFYNCGYRFKYIFDLDPTLYNKGYSKCRHVYEYVNAKICPDCDRHTHEPNWEEMNKQNRQWLKDNPEAWRNVGWWSI
jgi:hypothetical protein